MGKIKDSLRKTSVNSGAANFERGLAKVIAADVMLMLMLMLMLCYCYL